MTVHETPLYGNIELVRGDNLALNHSYESGGALVTVFENRITSPLMPNAGGTGSWGRASSSQPPPTWTGSRLRWEPTSLGTNMFLDFSATAGELVTVRIKVRAEAGVRPRIQLFSPPGINTDNLIGVVEGSTDGAERVLIVSGTVPAGESTVRIGVNELSQTGWIEFSEVSTAPIAFSSTYSRDPDLIPEASGVGSVLKGISAPDTTPIRGCVVVRSSLWSVSGAYSARIIRTDPVANSAAYVTTGDTPDTVSSFITLWNGEGIAALDRAVTIQDYFTPFSSTTMLSATSLPAAGEHVTVRGERTSAGSKRIVVGAPARVGDSIWVDAAGLFAGRSFIPDTKRITAHRGAARIDLGQKVDVGLMSFELHNAEDPLSGGTFKPGQKLTCLAGGRPIFTGTVADVSSAYPMNKLTGKDRAHVVITVADAVQQLSTHMRHGVTSAEGYETFEARINRYALNAPVPVEAPAEGGPREVYAF